MSDTNRAPEKEPTKREIAERDLNDFYRSRKGFWIYAVIGAAFVVFLIVSTFIGLVQ